HPSSHSHSDAPGCRLAQRFRRRCHRHLCRPWPCTCTGESALQMSMSDVLANGNPEGEDIEDALTDRAFVPYVHCEATDADIAEAARHDASAFGELYER